MSCESQGGLREQIREQATRLFALRGFAGTSMRDLVEACQCTKAACYYYFPSKEALYRDVVEHHSARIDTLLRTTLGEQGSIRERLHAGLDSIIDYAQAEPLAMRLMQRLELSPEDTAPAFDNCVSRETHVQMLSELVARGAATGEFRTDIDTAEGALVLAGAIQYQFDSSIASEIWDRKRMHNIIDLVLDGIANHE